MGTQWLVQYEGRAGGQARAVLGSEQLAREFAERHARATAPEGVPLKWHDTTEAIVLTTPLGSYCIVRAPEPTEARTRVR